MTDRFRLDGKTVVITGATGLLGRGYARAFVEAGAKVVVADRQAVDCDKLVAELAAFGPGQALSRAVDLAQESAIRAWAQGLLAELGSVDVLINNAAARSPNFFASLDQFPVDDWNQIMAVNVTAAFLTARELGSAMAKRGSGSVINVSSIYGVVAPDQRIYEGSIHEATGQPINTPLVYSASKGALIAMTKYLASYWGKDGVRVNTLTPGGVQSSLNETFIRNYSRRVPLGRMAQADEMIGAALFLASDASSYVSGQNLVVDGGLTAW